MSPRRFAYGIDPDSGGFALAIPELHDNGSRKVVHVERQKVDGKHSREMRTSLLHDLAGERLHDLAHVFPGLPPSIIGLEQPAGRFPAPALMAGWAAISTAASELVGDAVVWMTPPDWRGTERGVSLALFADAGDDLCVPEVRRIEGKTGRALPKAHALRSPSKRAALAVARAAGYDGWDDNVADAVSIGLAAARRLGDGRAVAA